MRVRRVVEVTKVGKLINRDKKEIKSC